jgi:two-component system NtrC family sensor kinase
LQFSVSYALKSYSHLDEGELVSTHLQEDIENTLALFKNQIRQGIEVFREYQDHLPAILCYADSLNQVWTNLIHNAIQSMKNKGVLQIRLKLWGKNHLAVEIEDNGPGIPLEIQSRIYEPYFTTKAKGEGTGMGLTISQKIIERHQGTLELLYSQVGKTCFRICLPLNTSLKQKEKNE